MTKTSPSGPKEKAPKAPKIAKAPKVPKVPAKRVDGQITGLAGELFVAAELLKRGLQTSVTFGNAKAVDLLAFNVTTGRTFTVQVKAIRRRNFFPIRHDRMHRLHTYVFAVLNRPGEPVNYFIVPGAALCDHPENFSKWFKDPKFPGIDPNFLKPYADGWKHFEEPVAENPAPNHFDVSRPDADINSADWTKQSWDLPPYKSREFMENFPDLEAFRKMPVYRYAVKNGLINDDEWVDDWVVPTPR